MHSNLEVLNVFVSISFHVRLLGFLSLRKNTKSVAFVCLFDLILLHPSQQTFSYVGTGLLGLNQYKARIKASCSRTQRSDTCEAQTRGPLVSSQALYH